MNSQDPDYDLKDKGQYIWVKSENGFDIYKDEQWDYFYYIEARKR